MKKLCGLLLFLFAFLFVAGAKAQETPDWTNPFPPYRIIGNIYYVGSQGLAVYLIATPQGNILINSNLEKSVPMIRESVEKDSSDQPCALGSLFRQRGDQGIDRREVHGNGRGRARNRGGRQG
jgi:hypothetical protein